MSAPFALYHDLGCGGLAFLLIEMPAPFSPIESRIARHLDGSPVSPSDPLVCESCGRPLKLEDVVTAEVRAAPAEAQS